MSRIIAGALTAGLIAASSLLVATPAHADPGDASAFGAFAGFDFELGPIVIDDQELLGSVWVTEPGTDTFSGEDLTLVDAILASVTIESIDTIAESTADHSTATAVTLGSSANLFGLSIVSFDTAVATVTCPTTGTPTADAVLEGLRIFGIPIDLSDDETATASDSITLPGDATVGDDEVDLSGLELTVTVAQTTQIEDTWASANAFEVFLTIEGVYEDAAVPFTFVGSMFLAGATCETPTAPTPPTPVVPAQLAATGADLTPVAVLGFGILIAGIAFVVARRARRV